MSSVSSHNNGNKCGQNNHNSAILPNGKVNVSLIEREIAQDLSADARYHAEDGMKKRAIHMSKDYDEFKNFVACSQLKPVPSHDMGQLFVARRTKNHHQCTNKVSSPIASLPLLGGNHNSSTHTHGQKSRTDDMPDPPETQPKRGDVPPTNAMELEREWKLCCVSARDTLGYLTTPNSALVMFCPLSNDESIRTLDYGFAERLRIEPEKVSQSLCRVEMDATIFGDILEALHYLLCSLASKSGRHVETDRIDSEKDEKLTRNEMAAQTSFVRNKARFFTHRWMVALTQSGRFSLNVAFLNRKQKEYVNSIFEHLQKKEVNDDAPSEIKICFTDERLHRLRNQYE